MSRRTTAWTAWSLWGLIVAFLALSLLLLARSLSYPVVRVFDLLVPEAVEAVSFSTLGVLIVPRRPKHPIGWLFCVLGLFAGLYLFFGVYAIYALLAEPGSLPGGSRLGSSPGCGCPSTPCWCFWRCCSRAVGYLRLAGGPSAAGTPGRSRGVRTGGAHEKGRRVEHSPASRGTRSNRKAATLAKAGPQRA